MASAARKFIADNRVKKLKVTDVIRDSGEFEGNSLSGSSCSPSQRRSAQGMAIPKYNFLNVPDSSGVPADSVHRRRKSSLAVFETQEKAQSEKREVSQEPKSVAAGGLPAAAALLKWPSITPSQIPEPDLDGLGSEGENSDKSGESIVFSRINDTASLNPGETDLTGKHSPSVATISLQVPLTSPKAKSRFIPRTDPQSCKPGLKVTSVAAEPQDFPASTTHLGGHHSHSPESKLLSPNISDVKSNQSPRGMIVKSKPEFIDKHRFMQSGSITTSLLVEADENRNPYLPSKPSGTEQLSFSANPNQTISDNSSQAIVSSKPTKARNPIKRNKNSFVITKANLKPSYRVDQNPKTTIAESSLMDSYDAEPSDVQAIDPQDLEILLEQRRKLAAEMSKLDSKIWMLKSVMEKNRSRNTSKVHESEWINIEENKTIKYSPRVAVPIIPEPRQNSGLGREFMNELYNDKKLLESFASHNISSQEENGRLRDSHMVERSKPMLQTIQATSSNASNIPQSEAVTQSWQPREQPEILRRGRGARFTLDRERKTLVRPHKNTWAEGSELSREKRSSSIFRRVNTRGSVLTEKRFDAPARNIGRSVDFGRFGPKEHSHDPQQDANLSKSIQGNDFSVNSKSVDTTSQVSRRLKAIVATKSPLVRKLQQPIKKLDLLGRRENELADPHHKEVGQRVSLVRGPAPIFQSFLFE